MLEPVSPSWDSSAYQSPRVGNFQVGASFLHRSERCTNMVETRHYKQMWDRRTLFQNLETLGDESCGNGKHRMLLHTDR